jgi:hypothetical protein
MNSIRKIGLISSILATIFAVIYNVAQILVLVAPPPAPCDFNRAFRSFAISSLVLHCDDDRRTLQCTRRTQNLKSMTRLQTKRIERSFFLREVCG